MRPIVRLLLSAVVGISVLTSRSGAELNLEQLKERQNRMRAVVQAAQPATVGILFPQHSGAGSGVLVAEDGLVLTAAHVSGEGGRDVTVILPDGERLPGKTLGAYRSLDAGMVQILAADRRFPTVPLGESAALKTGQWCLAIGHAGGFRKDRPAPVRLGRILDAAANGFLLTDSTLVGGDSGGPLLDLNGRLIGIHSSIGHDLAENRHVPIDIFRENWSSMRAGKITGQLFDWVWKDAPFLGVRPEAREDEAPGFRVGTVVPGSPAERVGLRAGDRILEFDGEVLSSGAELMEKLRAKQVGDRLRILVRTSGSRPREIEARLIALRAFEDEINAPTPKRPRPGYLGAVLSRAEGRLVVVKRLVPGTPAEKSGLRREDTILQYDENPMGALEDFVRYVSRRSPGDKLRLVVERRGELKRLDIALAARPE